MHDTVLLVVTNGEDYGAVTVTNESCTSNYEVVPQSTTYTTRVLLSLYCTIKISTSFVWTWNGTLTRSTDSPLSSNRSIQSIEKFSNPASFDWWLLYDQNRLMWTIFYIDILNPKGASAMWLQPVISVQIPRLKPWTVLKKHQKAAE